MVDKKLFIYDVKPIMKQRDPMTLRMRIVRFHYLMYFQSIFIILK